MLDLLTEEQKTIVNEMANNVNPGIYHGFVQWDENESLLDGNFTAEGLRWIADVMDAIKGKGWQQLKKEDNRNVD
jgi:hypothetical protein